MTDLSFSSAVIIFCVWGVFGILLSGLILWMFNLGLVLPFTILFTIIFGMMGIGYRLEQTEYA